jgi:hypothetical protein
MRMVGTGPLSERLLAFRKPAQNACRSPGTRASCPHFTEVHAVPERAGGQRSRQGLRRYFGDSLPLEPPPRHPGRYTRPIAARDWHARVRAGTQLICALMPG